MSQTATAAREPLLRIAKREGTTMPQKIAVRAIAILLALVSASASRWPRPSRCASGTAAARARS